MTPSSYRRSDVGTVSLIKSIPCSNEAAVPRWCTTWPGPSTVAARPTASLRPRSVGEGDTQPGLVAQLHGEWFRAGEQQGYFVITVENSLRNALRCGLRW